MVWYLRSLKNRTLTVSGFTVCIAALLGPASAQNRINEWSATGLNNDITVTDCRDCGDDIGLMISCQGDGRPAKVTVQWAAVERGRNGAVLPIVFRIDRRQYTYTAKTVEFGQIGFTPVFDLQANDPLVEALQSGRRATVRFSGSNTKIGLHGSRMAMRIFNAHCGWNRVAAQVSQTQVQPLSQGRPNAQGRQLAQGGQPAQGAPGVQGQTGIQPQAPRQGSGQNQGPLPTVNLFNALGSQVDIYTLDANGQPQFLASMQPGQRGSNGFRPGEKLVFGVAGQPVAEYVTGTDPQQFFDIGGTGAPSGNPAASQSTTQNQPRPSAQAPAPAPQTPNRDGLLWKVYNDGPGKASLVFGEPETDNIVLAAICRAGTGVAEVEFYGGPVAGRPGQPVALMVTTQKGRQQLRAVANSQGRPVLTGGPGSPFWSALLEPGSIAFSFNSQFAGQVDSISRSTEAGQFYTQCGWR